MHVIEVEGPILLPQDGLLLGNGDLSISLYQQANRLIWRFGKGDVWDRRLDRSRDPRPPHIDEIARGVRDEGWKCGPYGGGEVVATRGTKDPQRMRELCGGCPPSYGQPYPCPKPVGELALTLPPDLTGLSIRQRLFIEDGRIEIVCAWPAGVRLAVTGVIPPTPNVLVLHWTLEGWDDRTRIGLPSPTTQPLWFALYRWPDPTVFEFNERYFGEHRAKAARFGQSASDPTPLPPPQAREVDGHWLIEQTFPPDPLFPDGFRYWLSPVCWEGTIENASSKARREARLHLVPPDAARQGWLAVGVATGADEGGPAGESNRVRAALREKPGEVLQAWTENARQSAQAFWAKSSLTTSDAAIENAWYETLHARRCAYRLGTVPPGLFFPSTVGDYSLWHGDYHSNYNIQEPFWGDNTANHLELGDVFFEAMRWFWPMGRKIARDYYGCRGVFIQLTAYPIQAEDDVLGAVPMGRMAYMTGWVVSHYWWHYRYTMDLTWLRDTGYPAIRDCALFYTDFLKLGADDRYHAFPSNQGEDGFTGDPKDYTDRRQILQHVRYCLRVALRAAAALGADAELQTAWQDRLNRCAGDDGAPPVADDARLALNPPEYRPDYAQGVSIVRSYLSQPLSQPWPAPGDVNFDWYFGFYPWLAMQEIRVGRFSPTTGAFARLREMLGRWRRPNGLYCGMSIFMYGPAGAFTESQGILGPLQELLLQSWDGVIHVFPAWPADVDVQFVKWRAEGAFLVTAAWTAGTVTRFEVLSERGGVCRVRPPWASGVRVEVADSQPVAVTREPDGIAAFETAAGQTYAIRAD